MHRANLTIACVDSAQANVLVQAIGVEAEDGPDGTTTTVEINGQSVDISIAGADLSGLRAATHGILRLLDAAKRTIGDDCRKS